MQLEQKTRRGFVYIIPTVLLVLSFARPYDSSAFDAEKFLPFGSSYSGATFEASLHTIRMHPILKTPYGHGFEGKPIPSKYYKRMNGRVSDVLTPFYFREPSHEQEIRKAEHELVESFCRLVTGKSKQYVQDLAGIPTAVVNKIDGSPALQPGSMHWLYYFGYLDYSVDVIISKEYCTKASIFQGYMRLGWRLEEARRCPMIGKTKWEIEKFMGGNPSYESEDLLVFLMANNTWLEFHMKGGKCASWNMGHICS